MTVIMIIFVRWTLSCDLLVIWNFVSDNNSISTAKPLIIQFDLAVNWKEIFYWIHRRPLQSVTDRNHFHAVDFDTKWRLVCLSADNPSIEYKATSQLATKINIYFWVTDFSRPTALRWRILLPAGRPTPFCWFCFLVFHSKLIILIQFW